MARQDFQDPVKRFTDSLTKMANKAIPKLSAKPCCRSNPWFY